MSLPVKDGNGNLTSLKSTLTGSDHMPHHVVQAVSGTVTTKNKQGENFTRTKLYSQGFEAPINWTGSASGSFIIADDSSTRQSLMIFNPNAESLYVSIGNGKFSQTNGFGIGSVNSAPFDYSFILYPSGTYIADSGFVSAKHSGFFVSSSGISVSVYATLCD